MRRRLLPLLAMLLATSACSGSAADPEDRAKPRSSEASTKLTAWLGDLCTANKPMESV
jgi:ABC-type glycerol-3-phosphate transport system substrate-binding protein